MLDIEIVAIFSVCSESSQTLVNDGDGEDLQLHKQLFEAHLCSAVLLVTVMVLACSLSTRARNLTKKIFSVGRRFGQGGAKMIQTEVSILRKKHDFYALCASFRLGDSTKIEMNYAANDRHLFSN